MKKLTLLIFTLLLSYTSIAQQRAIKITSSESKREVIIKENKRVKVKTTGDEKVSGRFSIVDNQTIAIDGQNILFSEIAAIKRNSFLVSLLTSGAIIYLGAVTAGIGVIIGAFASSSGYWLLLPGAAMIYGGIKSPNIMKNYKTDKNWNFEVITLSD